jgi:hypothetical protein
MYYVHIQYIVSTASVIDASRRCHKIYQSHTVFKSTLSSLRSLGPGLYCNIVWWTFLITCLITQVLVSFNTHYIRHVHSVIDKYIQMAHMITGDCPYTHSMYVYNI